MLINGKCRECTIVIREGASTNHLACSWLALPYRDHGSALPQILHVCPQTLSCVCANKSIL